VEGPVTSVPGPHRLVNPPELAPPIGFSHAVSAAPGRVVYLGGQAGLDAAGIVDPTAGLVEQFDLALANLAATLRAAGAEPEHLVTLTVYATDGDDYRSKLRELGAVYRRHLGRHYPAMAFFEVKGLFDPVALVEVTGIAVVPAADGSPSPVPPGDHADQAEHPA
jgi:enamine deaminase RidA (YjgF/YER057c/UK114 family)